MKASWKTVKLGEVCEVLDYKRRPVTKADRRAGPYPYYGATGVQDYVDQFIFDEPLVLLGEDGAKWKSGDRSAFQVSGKTWVNNHAHVLRPNREVIVDEWLVYWLNHSDLTEFVTGVTVPKLNQANMMKIPVELPSLAEQKRIVALLDEAFAGIDEAKAKAEANLENAHALFESRLEDAFISTNTDWTDASLTDVLEKQPQNGWSPPAANHSESGTPVLTLSSVTGFKFKPDKIKHTSAKVDTSKGYWINNGDLVITRSNTPELVGHVAIVAGISVPTIYPDLIMRMTPKQSRATTAFLYYQLRTRKLRKLITGRAQGANPTMKKISNEAVRTLPISLPSLVKQDEIVKGIYVIESASQELSSNFNRTLAALSELKASILAQAFSGELTA